MGSTNGTLGLAMVLGAVLWARTVAQTSNCTSTIISMAPCLNFVTGSSSTPTSQCCSQLSTVVQSNPRCLCLILDGAASSLGVSINRTLALALPGACNVQTPPVSECNGVGSPQGSPSDSSNNESTSGGSKTVPSVGTSEGGVGKKPLKIFVLFAVMVAPYASINLGQNLMSFTL